MRAVIVEQPGGPEVLTVVERETPEPGAGEVRVDLAAGGINFIDVYQRSGAYVLPLPFVGGNEGAGVVSAVGDAVSEVSVGDRVAWAMVPQTGYAEEVLVPATRLVPVPEGMELELAAAAMLQGLTAHYLVNSTFEAKKGQTAIVTGASGGVGLLLCQMLRDKGVRVIGTVGRQEKVDLALEAGAADVVLYREVDLAQEVHRLTDGHGVHVVYDGVGKDTFDAGISQLRPRGLMVLFGAASGAVPPVDPVILNKGGSLYLTRPTLANYISDREELLWRAGAVLGAVADGSLTLRIGGRYPLAAARHAHEDLVGGGTTGKLLISP
ncbi:MAG: quinone oxidoreductase [Ornithinimicrobium sp.]|uniref:quinone oxidoreductase family protein n=1 Tax=Ornithinimicrobium sp. TaxID=1977084 RepID=UPI0026E006F2|nr:quinone oxidoreductase [Ornithinimicrobium sp.]MDO5740227.1 quinone oxidoreductase [Ornithinimicrobium sp.]